MLPGFVRAILMSHCDNDETGQNTLFGRYLNNRRTGKDATKPHTLGLLGHSDYGAHCLLWCEQPVIGLL